MSEAMSKSRSEARAITAPSLESLVAGVADEFLERQKRGEQPDIEEYARRHPEAAGPIRDVLMSLRAIGAGTGLGEVSAGVPGPVTGCLGDFRILREAGRGGMGIVYEAEQISLGRRVALKVLPFAATLDPRQLQRFKNEAQAAAQLHHTNIVPIHFVGVDRGVHFYAMQFIDGQSLAQVIEELRGECSAERGAPCADEPPALRSPLSTQVAAFTERSVKNPACFRTVARLGLQAAQALEHAHDMGIVHRDIKPANLLLDSRGNLWITDFGLAHVHCDAQLTLTGDVVGTLRYMSPEQALGAQTSGAHLAVDQRTDIYALGATLYELLTLEPVFSGQQRLELLQQIARREPIAPRRIAPALPVDLETIVLKALAKNPAERYQTAAELSGDLQRFLDDKAIQARRPTLRQCAARWARRHAVAVRAAAVMLALAVVCLATSTALIWHSREETRAALAKAERSQQLAEAAVNDMYTEVAEKWLEQEPQSDPLQREFLLKALKYFQELARQSSESPQLTQKTALALKRAGVIQYKFGQDAKAETNLSAAIGLLNSLATVSPENAAYRRQELASCHNARAIVLMHLGKRQEAERDFRQARAMVAQMLQQAPAEHALQHDLARYGVNLAALLIGAGRLPEAEKEFSRALEIDTELARQKPGVTKYRLALANTQSQRGILWWKTGQLDEAEKAWQEAARLARELNAADPRQRQHREILVNACGYLVALHHAAGRFQDAENLLLENIRFRKSLVDDFPRRLEYEEHLADALHNLGMLQDLNHRRDRGENSYREATKILRRLLARNPGAVRSRSQLASTCNNLANVLKDTGRVEEAISGYREALGLLEKQPEDCRREPKHRDDLTIYLNNLGYVCWRAGKASEAEPLLSRAVELREQLVNDFPRIAGYREKLVGFLVNLGWLLQKAGRVNDAEAPFRAALQHAQQLATSAPNGEHQKVLANRQETLGRILWESGRTAEGREMFRAARAAWRRALDLQPRDPTLYHLAARFLADCPDAGPADWRAGAGFAEQALALAAKPTAEFWTTLGLVRYRAGDWQAAAAALAQAGSTTAEERCLRDFLCAMTYARLGKERFARESFDLAMVGMTRLWLLTDNLERRRLEAEALLSKMTPVGTGAVAPGQSPPIFKAH